MRDIEKMEDIRQLVDEFYGKVRRDEMLGPVFEERIGNNWDSHLDKMYRFWQTVLLDEGQTYFGNPFIRHASLPIFGQHFERWLELWKETLHHHFKGPKVEEANMRANKMAYVFMTKLEAIRGGGGSPVF